MRVQANGPTDAGCGVSSYPYLVLLAMDKDPACATHACSLLDDVSISAKTEPSKPAANSCLQTPGSRVFRHRVTGNERA